MGLHKRKDFPGDYFAGIDDGAKIWVVGPHSTIWFYPFLIDMYNEDSTEVQDEFYRYAGQSPYCLAFDKQSDQTWRLSIGTIKLESHIHNVPLELKDHLVALCNEFHDNPAVPPLVK